MATSVSSVCSSAVRGGILAAIRRSMAGAVDGAFDADAGLELQVVGRRALVAARLPSLVRRPNHLRSCGEVTRPSPEASG